METQKLNELEIIQNKLSKINYIKSYPVLSRLKISQNERNLIELVYSYNSNNKSFFMNYNEIADILNIKVQSVKNLVGSLKKLGYLITNHSKNFNGRTGGSSTSLNVNIELIINQLNETCNVVEENKEIKEEQIEMRNSLTKAYNSEIESQQTYKPAKAEVKPIEVKLTKEQAEEKIELDSLTITPESTISNSDFKIVEEQEEPKQTNIEYNHQLVLNCGKVVDIPIKYNDIWEYCQDRKGTMKKIKSCMSENTVYGYFDEEIKKLKEEEEMFNAYSTKYA